MVFLCFFQMFGLPPFFCDPGCAHWSMDATAGGPWWGGCGGQPWRANGGQIQRNKKNTTCYSHVIVYIYILYHIISIHIISYQCISYHIIYNIYIHAHTYYYIHTTKLDYRYHDIMANIRSAINIDIQQVPSFIG